MDQRLDVTDALVRQLIDEMAPLVAQATGWDLGLETLRSRVIPQDRGYEEILLGRLRGLGIPVEDEQPRPWLERLTEYLVESNVLAAYEPSRQEILVVRENVDDSNLDGLRLVVAHELVHRGQHVHHGELFARVDEMAREVFRLIGAGPGGLAAAFRKMQEIQPLMTLMESHAHYVQDLLGNARFPGAVVESHFSLASLLLRLIGAAKMWQYRDGLPAVAEAAARGCVDSLYAGLAGRQPGFGQGSRHTG